MPIAKGRLRGAMKTWGILSYKGAYELGKAAGLKESPLQRNEMLKG